jgi:murein DD-endopeptidase MepM/ murein hydrolase activator NlpD
MQNGVTPAWTLILVPPTPTRSPRRVGVKMRTVRMFFMLMTAIAAVAASWMLATSDTAEAMADRLAEEQRLTMALDDTVQSLRTAAYAATAAKLPPVAMAMPLEGEITSRFSRSRFHPILQIFRAHRGVDLAAPMGTHITAPAAGRVVSVGRRLGYGLVIEVVHSGGVVTRYAHCRSSLVQTGDTVSMGQAIGLVGESGLATAPHLHFEVWFHGAAVDPIKFIASTHLSAPIASVRADGALNR